MANQPSDSAAAGRGKVPKKAVIRTEEAKQQQVSHWDMDYLPAAAVAAAINAGKPAGGDQPNGVHQPTS